MSRQFIYQHNLFFKTFTAMLFVLIYLSAFNLVYDLRKAKRFSEFCVLNER